MKTFTTPFKHDPDGIDIDNNFEDTMTTEKKKLFKTVTTLDGKTHKINKSGYWICQNCMGVDKHKRNCPSTPPQTGKEWEPRLKEILDGMDITELTHGIGEIVQLIRSLIATARAEERDKTIKKAKSIVLTCYVDEDTREHRIHDDALDLVYSRLEALNGRKV